MLRSLIILTFCTGWTAAVNSLTLSPCTDSDGIPGSLCPCTPGIGCQASCVPNSIWCREDIQIQCSNQLGEEFWTNDTELCGDSLFWSKQTCDLFYRDVKYAIGQRCSGGTQHCINPWYNSGTYEVSEQLII